MIFNKKTIKMACLIALLSSMAHASNDNKAEKEGGKYAKQMPLELNVNYIHPLNDSVAIGATVFGQYIFASQKNECNDVKQEFGKAIKFTVGTHTTTLLAGFGPKFQYFIQPTDVLNVECGLAFSLHDTKSVTAPITTLTTKDNAGAFGFFAGIGYTRKVTDNIGINVSYRFTRIGGINKDKDSKKDSDQKNENTYAHINHQGLLGLTYFF